MTSIDQKERYRGQSALCLDMAGEMNGERAASMLRLAETYATLAEDDPTLTPPAIYVDPQCPRCGRKMRVTLSLARADALPAVQRLQCDACGKTTIWKTTKNR
jgi:transposase-like protein